LIEESAHLIDSLGKSWEVLSGAVHSLRDMSDKYGLSQNLQAGVQSIQVQVTKAAAGVLASLSDFFGGLVGLIVVLVMAYYMVVQEKEARNAFQNFVPTEYQDNISAVLKHVEEKIGMWLFGQIALCLIIGVCYFIGLSIIGLNATLVLALFGGFTEFIPYLGPILGAIPVAIVALSDSPVKALMALMVIIVIQQLEGHIIVPKVMQRAVGLNPLVSIIALLVGAKLFGIMGALLAIPVATALSAALSELYRQRQRKIS
jgi:predicted PurR-regulated permease PerM